jgi:hypothetical protein
MQIHWFRRKQWFSNVWYVLLLLLNLQSTRRLFEDFMNCYFPLIIDINFPCWYFNGSIARWPHYKLFPWENISRLLSEAFHLFYISNIIILLQRIFSEIHILNLPIHYKLLLIILCLRRLQLSRLGSLYLLYYLLTKTEACDIRLLQIWLFHNECQF